ncbi:MAG TPA: 2-succinyl-5-enolpyruvyl-6-hydroxy-3-cyclohexene-1-carboxylic-acid synthase [Polyangiaceae bacterium]|nr:2-succinyl-5-enolpyruvyl-6-hydroxy-3-cyclohexene-1-carboxylic-acid synthase [Polyangiaceae bacterium]
MSAALLTEWSRLLLGSLARAGVEDVVLSPGSRSTPFAWAALSEPRFRCHSLADERVAAFFALGQARLSGRPSLLICTSGTAAANYYPAVIEASLSRLPLLILTADRPFELQHSAAPQAIDQIKLFGETVRAFFELGTPDAAPSALSGVVRSVAHAAHIAGFPEPGPVHLNARARKPLEPVQVNDAASVALRSQVDELLERGPTSASGATLQGDVTRLARACAQSARGLIMVGPHQPSEAAPALARLAKATGFPLLCEATGQLRFAGELAAAVRLIDGFDWLLRSARLRETLRPELILSFGQTPTSGSYERLLNGGFSGQRFVISPHGFPDPHGLATELISASSELAALATILLLEQSGLHDAEARDSFGQAWSEANREAWQHVDRELARPSPTLDEARAVRSVLDHVPNPSLLVLGNSLPIREVDAYVPSAKRGLRVLSQRGANGIDGLISGAAGAASRALEPTVLLLGDVSFMHDLGGLAAARASLGPLSIVVIDNGGGRIFEQLPIFTQLENHAESARFWLTPPAVDISHAAQLFGYRYLRVTRDAEIGEAMRRATSALGVSVVHVVVDGSSAREAEQRVREALERPPGSGA